MSNIRILNPNNLIIPDGEKIKHIFKSVLDAVDPDELIKKIIRLQDEKILIKEKPYNLSTYKRVFLLGFGKASQSMALSVLHLLDKRISSGLVITKVEDSLKTEKLLPRVNTIHSSHPIPDEKSIFAAEEIIRFSKNITENDLVICLISGGGSAVVTKPVEGVSLEAIQNLTNQLLQCGATIHEINTIRKHLDVIKGGGLLTFLFPAQIVTLILSDVIGDDLSMIASGPTVPDPTTYRDAIKILQKYSMIESIDKRIIQHLEYGKKGIFAETVKNNDPRLKKIKNIIIGNNHSALLAAKETAERMGYSSHIITKPFVGNVSKVGKEISKIIEKSIIDYKNISKPLCIIGGGESTAKIKGKGLGGRNQEVALFVSIQIDGHDNVCVATLATDGEDGPTDAAGAIVTGRTIQTAQRMGMDAGIYLSNNDSYRFFEKVGGLIKTGSTGTNVNDLNLIFIN